MATNAGKFGKLLLKAAASMGFYYLGLFKLYLCLANSAGRRLTILTYHRVTNEDVDQIEASLPYLFVNDRTFEKQIKFLKKHYNIITLRSLEPFTNATKLPRNSLLITFDDGYEDNFVRAYPILLKHNCRFCVFLAVDWLRDRHVPWWDELYSRLKAVENARRSGAYPKLNRLASRALKEFEENPSRLFSILNDWGRDDIHYLLDSLSEFHAPGTDVISRNRPMSWSMVKKMVLLAEFGSHGCTHRPLVQLETEDAKREALDSKQEIECRVGTTVAAFCYPAGKYSEKIKKIVAEAKYKFAVTQDKGINCLKNTYALKRINVWEKTGNLASGKFSKSQFALKVSGF